MEMRRKDLAVTEKEQIDAIIQSCDCVRLAFADGTHPYIGEGTITELKTPEEKTAGLQVIMKHYSDRTDWTFPEAVLNRTCVFCLTVVELSGRAHG